ncbi:unnamed protein product [Dovyalis caffra]|uniref:Uncharacterized protein n=1 Tax=Dovyalis caffra TaxID=77055 RepID=A0AAV1RFE2_9ROSI|nr:unnamed protein product [Dovyalis caffra]
MEANTSEEDLPAGWAVHFTLLRSGRKIKEQVFGMACVHGPCNGLWLEIRNDWL